LGRTVAGVGEIKTGGQAAAENQCGQKSAESLKFQNPQRLVRRLF
jgi:hypothetical protein